MNQTTLFFDSFNLDSGININACFIGQFISSFSDLKFINNLIWKNGIVGNLFISAENVFTDSTVDNNNNKVNSFVYVDFECDDNLIRLYNQTLPVEYVEALKVVTTNSLRIWDVEMDINNMPNYYIAFAETAYNILHNVV